MLKNPGKGVLLNFTFWFAQQIIARARVLTANQNVKYRGADLVTLHTQRYGRDGDDYVAYPGFLSKHPLRYLLNKSG